ncbi:hypothetical protein DM01DRAFT_1411261 [Hesseltinella vesiculosa]|uniref:LIM zinc-binding domain-containing protein n=1 Tax=Hesseltinella vesiculosa TaxID=101127 RepID=A0A1X2G4A8_9FUNG|nr:hypothetical protein DM01DRAFT_1411261 [Hesseltinella vesiculosa]
MGYCNRCGDIIGSSKCRKCGGKAVESIAKGAVQSRGSIIDRWQNQYADSILSGPGPTATASTPLNKRASMSSISTYTSRYRSPSMSVQPKTCIYCHKAIPLGTQLGKSDACHQCRTNLFETKQEQATVPQLSSGTQCVECSQPVKLTDPKFQHQGRTWHKECIRCFECQQPIRHPTALDVNGKSRCLVCQRKSRPRAASFNTGPRPIGLSSQAYRSPLPTSASPVPPASPASPMSPSPQPSASISTASGKKLKASKKSCRKCQQVLRGPRVKLPTPSGETWYYHIDCLTCAACGDQFTSVEFIGDGKDVFHLHCRPASPPTSLPPSPCCTSPQSLPSPPPVLPTTTQSTPLPPHRLATPPLDYRCYTCSLPIVDKCLKNGSKFFHPKCFCCFQCRVHLPSDKPFYEFKEEAYCDKCTMGLKAQDSQEEDQVEKDTTPSHIWRNRTRALPKLGGSKICPGCSQSIAVMDITSGPKGSRWHKKCLRCTGCKKQMDSGAKVIENGQSWVVRCSDCSDRHPRPKYVR